VYLTVTLDLFDREVIGWALSADMETAHTAIPAVDMAFKKWQAQEGLLFHSDREYSIAQDPFAACWKNDALR
jgi:transposase InsO family protein